MVLTGSLFLAPDRQAGSGMLETPWGSETGSRAKLSHRWDRGVDQFHYRARFA